MVDQRAKLQDILDLYPEIEIITADVDMPTSEKAAHQYGYKIDQIAKTLIIKANDFYIAAILQGSDRLNMQVLPHLMGDRTFRFTTPEEVKEITSYPAGGVAPIALGPNIKKVYIDRKVMLHELVITGGGERHKLLKLSPALIVKLNNAEITDLT